MVDMLTQAAFKKLFGLTLIVGCGGGLFSITSLAMAESSSPPMRPGFAQGRPPGGFNEDFFISKLNLTPVQTQKFKEVREASKAKAAPLKQAMQAKRAELMNYLFSLNADQNKALALHHQIGQIQNQLGTLRLQTLFQMRAILTPDQLKQFIQLHQQREAQFKNHEGPHHMPSPNDPRF